MNFSFVKQSNYNDCGAAVMCMIINTLYNKNIKVEEFKFDNKINDTPMSFNNIAELSSQYGLDFASYSSTFEEFLEFKIIKPIILNVLNKNNDMHYIVVYKRKGNKYLIADPSSQDFSWVKIDELKNIFNNYFGVFTKTKNLTFNNKKIFNFFYLLKNSYTKIILIFLINIFLNILIIIINNFLKVYFNLINSNSHTINSIFITFIIFISIQFLLLYISNKLIESLKNNINYEIFILLKNNLLDLSLEEFETQPKEEWLNKFYYSKIISNYIVTSIIRLPVSFILFIFSLSIIYFTSSVILLLIVLENFLFICFGFIFSFLSKNIVFKNKNVNLKMSSEIYELVHGFKSLKSKGLDKIKKSTLTSNYTNHLKSDLENKNIEYSKNLIIEFISKIFYFLIFYFSIKLILKNQIKTGELLFYSSISYYINNFSLLIINIIPITIDAKKISSKLFILLKNKESNKKENFYDSIKFIELKNIYKFYNETKLVGKVDCVFNQNTFVYGSSGSGKSSLLKIIGSLYSDYDGIININGINIKHININSYKEKILYMSDNEYLFSGTIWENIQMFKNKININTFKELNLFELLKKHKINISHVINNELDHLSIGQKQIINFLSFFFVKKDLLIIDDSLNAVDKNSAYELMEKLITHQKNSIIIFGSNNNYLESLFKKRLEVV